MFLSFAVDEILLSGRRVVCEFRAYVTVNDLKQCFSLNAAADVITDAGICVCVCVILFKAIVRFQIKMSLHTTLSKCTPSSLQDAHICLDMTLTFDL